MVSGYVGKILWVDLTTAKFSTLDTLKYTDYIGGKGIALRLQWEFGNPEVKDGLDPRALFMIFTGPLAGTPSPSMARQIVCFKETSQWPKNWWCHSGAGGWFNSELKFAGYDGIVFQGASPKPVYLWVDDGKAELRDASNIWLEDTYMTQDLIRKELGGDPKIQMGVIGPSGANKCRNSCVLFGTSDGAGQHPGASMGSKNLKAVAVRGTGGVPVANPEALLAEQWRRISLLIVDREKRFRETDEVERSTAKHGISCFACTNPGCRAYLMPSDGPRGGNWCGFSKCYQLIREVEKGRSKLLKTPFGDVVFDPRLTELSPEGRAGDRYEDISYQFAKLLDLYGISGYDQIATRGNPGLLMYLCHDEVMGDTFKNLVKAEWGGLPGSTAYALNAPRAVAFRQGKLGELFADGVTLAALRLKEHPEDYGLTKAQGQFAWDGLERLYPKNNAPEHHFYRPTTTPSSGESDYRDIMQAPIMAMLNGLGIRDVASNTHSAYAMYDDSSKNSFAHALAAFGTEAAGARYLDADGKPVVKNQLNSPEKGKHYTIDLKESKPVKGNWTVGTPQALKIFMALGMQTESLLLCDNQFPQIAGKGLAPSIMNDPDKGNDVEMGARLYSAVTGINRTYEQLLEDSWRCCDLERAIHIRDNDRTREDDYFTHFIHDRPDRHGVNIDRTEYRKGLDMFAELMGYDKATGNPTRATLEKHGLKDVADKLQSLGKLP